jgi:hypothetical protein
MGWLNKKYPVAQAGISKTIQQELEWREEELNAPPARRKIHNLKDNRKTRATTNKPINPNVDLVSGKFSLQPLNDLMHYAKKQGLSKEDMYNLAAIDLQETRWGATDNQTGHVQGDYGKENLSENFVEAYKYKMKEADRLGISDPAERLQVYNGRGKIFPDTEEDYHGFKMKKIYGVPVPKEGLDLRKDPLYGKQILDIRDNVLKKNAWLTEYVDSVDASRTAPYKKLQPYSIDTHWARNDIPQEPDSMQDGGWLDNLQDGGIIEGQRGQWDNPGEVTRIQGGNITMKADPLNGKQLTQPLLGISDKGERQIMHPGEDYSFKDAKHVTEYPIAQDGKSSIKVQSKNDPRYVAYKDSLALYNNYIDLTKVIKEQGYSKWRADSLNVARNKTPLPNSWFGNSRSAIASRDTQRMNKSWEKEKEEATNKEGLARRVSPTLMETPDFITGVINRTLPNQLYSDTIDPTSLDRYTYPLDEEFQNSIWGKVLGSGLKNEEAIQKYNKSTGDYRPGDARVVANYSNVNPKQEVAVEMMDIKKDIKKMKSKSLKGSKSGLKEIPNKDNTTIREKSKLPKAKIPKSYSVKKEHIGHTTTGTLLEDEVLGVKEQYDRLSKLGKNAPKLTIKPNYKQNGGWLDKY